MVPFNDVMLPPQRAVRQKIYRITLTNSNEHYHCGALVIMWMTERGNVLISDVMTAGQNLNAFN